MAALLSAGLMILFGGYLFGDSLYLFKDIGSDTLNYYYPQMLNVSNYLREEGIPAWSFYQCMGQNKYVAIEHRRPELSFTRPYWRLSLILSGIGFTVFVVALAWSIIIKHKKNKKISEENLSESSE
jgi:hypothetical protein